MQGLGCTLFHDLKMSNHFGNYVLLTGKQTTHLGIPFRLSYQSRDMQANEAKKSKKKGKGKEKAKRLDVDNDDSNNSDYGRGGDDRASCKFFLLS